MGQSPLSPEVILLWVGLSAALWAQHRLRLIRRHRRERETAGQAARCVDQAQAVFDAVRAPASAEAATAADAGDRKQVRLAALEVLRRLQEQSGYFDAAAALDRKTQTELERQERSALGEILEIRRDLWGAANVVLKGERRRPGGVPEAPPAHEHSAHEHSACETSIHETSWGEAARLLFKDAKSGEAKNGEDPIDLRLSWARQASSAFVDRLEKRLSAIEERERLPTGAGLSAILKGGRRFLALFSAANLASPPRRGLKRVVLEGFAALKSAVAARHRE